MAIAGMVVEWWKRENSGRWYLRESKLLEGGGRIIGSKDSSLSNARKLSILFFIFLCVLVYCFLCIAVLVCAEDWMVVKYLAFAVLLVSQ